jgi:diguanylate cyclase (GGDEF)-like protein
MPKSNDQKNRPQALGRRMILKYFAIIYLPLLLGMAVPAYVYFDHESSVRLDALQLREKKQVELSLETLDANLGAAAADVAYLADRASAHLAADAATRNSLRPLMRTFYDFTRTRRRFTTARFIDASGSEVVRAGPNAAVSEPMSGILDRKDWADDEFFRGIEGLRPGGFAVSWPACETRGGRVDPGIEPAFRLGAPVMRDRKFAGAVVLDHTARPLLEKVRRNTIISRGDILLMNGDGSLPIGLDPKEIPTFPDAGKPTFSETFPKAWAKISASEAGASLTEEGLFTFAAYRPSGARVRNATPGTEKAAPENGCLRIVSRVPPNRLDEIRSAPAFDVGAAYTFLMLLLAPGCLLMSRAKVQSMVDRDKLMRLNANLNETVRRMEKKNHETSLINRLSDFLQACRSEDEIFDVAARYAGALLPGTSGDIYDLRETHNELVRVGAWGESNAGEEVFDQEECWAIRRGRPHFVARPDTSHNCSHFEESVPVHGYLCVPLIAHGRVTGLISFEFEPGALDESREGRAEAMENFEQLAMTLSDHAALSLANLRLRESLRDQSIRDALTGLYNRRHMEDALSREFSRAERHEHPVSLIMFDVDRFKNFNDEYGHEAGDQVLKELAAMLERNTRGEDIACRLGGEEFLVIMPETPPEQAEKRAEEFRRLVDESLTVRHGEKRLGVTVSLGVAAYPEHARDVDEALAKVDEAMYAAKQAGRNAVRTASP